MTTEEIRNVIPLFCGFTALGLSIVLPLIVEKFIKERAKKKLMKRIKEMKWELNEDSPAYKYLKLNCIPERFERRRMWLELKAENELDVRHEYRSVDICIPAAESVSGYEFYVRASAKDFH